MIDLKSQKLLDETTNGKWRKFVKEDKIEKDNTMTLKEILSRLELIEGELDDATNTLPEYNANSDSRGYIDGAKCELYHLNCLLYTSPSPRDKRQSRMPSSA